MSQFSAAWELSRSRLFDTIKDLSSEQLRWRLHDQSLSIGEMVIHVAGVETSFCSQLAGSDLSPEQLRLKAAATDGVVNDLPFPYSESEITAETVAEAFAEGAKMVKPLIDQPTDEILSKEIVSALGPVITGAGAFTRLSFHAAYHQGQAYLIRTHPDFPTA
jgi:uncharacterized damage-inducible protein DinB